MTKGGFVKLNDDGQPAPAPEEQLHEHEHEHEHDLEDVSLSGTITGEAPAWLAAGAAAVPASRVRRGSSDETVPASTASSAFPSTDDLTSDHQHQQQPPPPSRRPQGPLVQAPAPPKRGGRAAGAGAWLGCWWLAVALLLASMNPSVLSGLMYKSAAAEDYVYTPVSILGAANLCGLLVAVRCGGVAWCDASYIA